METIQGYINNLVNLPQKGRNVLYLEREGETSRLPREFIELRVVDGDIKLVKFHDTYNVVPTRKADVIKQEQLTSGLEHILNVYPEVAQVGAILTKSWKEINTPNEPDQILTQAKKVARSIASKYASNERQSRVAPNMYIRSQSVDNKANVPAPHTRAFHSDKQPDEDNSGIELFLSSRSKGLNLTVSGSYLTCGTDIINKFFELTGKGSMTDREWTPATKK